MTYVATRKPCTSVGAAVNTPERDREILTERGRDRERWKEIYNEVLSRYVEVRDDLRRYKETLHQCRGCS